MTTARPENICDFDKPLEFCPGIRFELKSESVHISWPSGNQLINKDFFPDLILFCEPRSIREALNVEKDWSKSRWAEWASTLRGLYLGEALLAQGSTPNAVARGFSHPAVHIAMLKDQCRTAAFIKGLKETVGPEDVVLDLGTGTGVLAVAAAIAGAKHVYAVDAGEAIHIAREVVELNGVQDRVTLIEGWSTAVKLPEPATIVVSETLGNQPLAEEILASTWDASRRLCKPNARFLPCRLQILAYPVLEADAKVEVGTTELSQWKDVYGVNLTPLIRWNSQSSRIVRMLCVKEFEHWQEVSNPIMIFDQNLPVRSDSHTKGTASWKSKVTAVVSGVVIAFRAQISENNFVSTCVGEGVASSWRTVLFRLEEQQAVLSDRAYSLEFDLTPALERFIIKAET